jgi:hypothetical protein
MAKLRVELKPLVQLPQRSITVPPCHGSQGSRRPRDKKDWNYILATEFQSKGRLSKG